MKDFLNECLLFQSDEFVIIFIGFAFWFDVFVMCFGIYLTWNNRKQK